MLNRVDRVISRLETIFERTAWVVLILAVVLYATVRVQDRTDRPAVAASPAPRPAVDRTGGDEFARTPKWLLTKREVLPAPDVEICYPLMIDAHFEAFGPNPDSWPDTIAGRGP